MMMFAARKHESLLMSLIMISLVACSQGGEVHLSGPQTGQPRNDGTAIPESPAATPTPSPTDEGRAPSEPSIPQPGDRPGDEPSDPARPPRRPTQPTPPASPPPPAPSPRSGVAKTLRFACASSEQFVIFSGFDDDEKGQVQILAYDVAIPDPKDRTLPGENLRVFTNIAPVRSGNETMTTIVEAAPINRHGGEQSGLYLVQVDLLYKVGRAKRLGGIPSKSNSFATSNMYPLNNYGGSGSKGLVLIPKGGSYEVRNLAGDRRLGSLGVSPSSNFNPRFVDDGKYLLLDQSASGGFRARRYRVNPSGNSVSFSAANLPATGTQNFAAYHGGGLYSWMGSGRTIHVWNETTGAITKIKVPTSGKQPVATTLVRIGGKPHVFVGQEAVRRKGDGYELTKGEIWVYDLGGRKVDTIQYPDDVKTFAEYASGPSPIDGSPGTMRLPLLTKLETQGSQVFAYLPGRYGRIVFRWTDERGWVRLTAGQCTNGIFGTPLEDAP